MAGIACRPIGQSDAQAALTGVVGLTPVAAAPPVNRPHMTEYWLPDKNDYRSRCIIRNEPFDLIGNRLPEIEDNQGTRAPRE